MLVFVNYSIIVFKRVPSCKTQ